MAHVEVVFVNSTKKVSVENKDYGSLQGFEQEPSSLSVEGIYGHTNQTITCLPDLALKLGSSGKLPALVKLTFAKKSAGTKTILVAIEGEILDVSSGLFPKFMNSLFNGLPMTFPSSSAPKP